jgi:tetratricopeptide (TPR) repeat protein
LVGSIFAQHKRPREAQKLFESAIAANKEPFQRIGLARLLMDHGQLEQGLEVARTAEKLAQSSLCHSGVRAHAVALQARAYIRMNGRRNLARARSLLRKSKRINRVEPSVLITSGLYFEKMGKKKKAKEQYRRLLELDENSFEAQYRLGRLLFAQKRTRREGRALLDGLTRARTQTLWSDKARGLLP